MTWRDWFILTAEAGMEPSAVNESYPGYVQVVIEGYNSRCRVSWEQTRSLAFTVACFGYTDSSKLPKTPQAFWSLPWDDEEAVSAAQSIVQGIIKQHEEMKILRQQARKLTKKFKWQVKANL